MPDAGLRTLHAGRPASLRFMFCPESRRSSADWMGAAGGLSFPNCGALFEYFVDDVLVGGLVE